MPSNKKKLRKILVALDPNEKSNVRTAELAEGISEFIKKTPRSGKDGQDGKQGERGESVKGDKGVAGKDGRDGKDGESAKEDVKKLRADMVKVLKTKGGQAHRQINVDSSVVSTRYADVNFLAGSNITLSKSDDNTKKRADVTITSGDTAASVGGAITGGDVGAVLFVNPASVLSQDSANFFWDDANKRLGIGNNAPAVSLEVGDATKEEIIRASSGVNGNAILSANSFLSTGNPLTQYVVAGGNNWVTGVDNADSDKYKISFHITDLGTNNFLAITNAGDFNFAAGDIVTTGTVQGVTQAEFDTLTDNSMADTLHRHSELSASDGTPDQALVVDAAGKVGIGIATPDSKLHIKANTPGTVGSHPAGQLIIQDPDDTVFGNAVITGYESDGSGNPDQQLWYLGSSSSSNSNIIFLNRRNALLQFGTNGNTQMTILGNGDVGIGIATPPTNATKLTIEDGLTFKEISAPTADLTYGKIWTETNNELFFQSGDGTTHLLHGDAFSEIWFHAASTVEVTISTQNALTKIDSFTVVGHEDDLANLVGNISTNDLTLSAIAGGEYEISYHASITATGGADKEMLLVVGITLATPKDITDVTDDTITPIVITSTAHGLENGDMVEIVGVLGNTAANGSFIVDSKAADTFEIVDLSGGATTGNGNFDAGSPTGDVTIEYPGNMVVHRMVRGADLGAVSATGLHILANSDVLGIYVANLDGTTNLTVAAISFDAFRIGD